MPAATACGTTGDALGARGFFWLSSAKRREGGGWRNLIVSKAKAKHLTYVRPDAARQALADLACDLFHNLR